MDPLSEKSSPETDEHLLRQVEELLSFGLGILATGMTTHDSCFCDIPLLSPCLVESRGFRDSAGKRHEAILGCAHFPPFSLALNYPQENVGLIVFQYITQCVSKA